MDIEAPIPKRIREALEAKGFKIGDFYQNVGINSQYIRNLNVQGSIPAADTAIKMAEYLCVSVKWLITGQDDEGLSQNEQILLSQFNLLDSKNQEEILGIIQLKINNLKKGENLSSSGIA